MMASGGSRVVTGAFVGTAADLEVRTVGFRPRRVDLTNVTGLVTASWQDTMADDSMCLRVTAGDMTFPTTNGITPLSDGFAVGANADLNASAETVHWTAYE
jgi:hypothetical protein